MDINESNVGRYAAIPKWVILSAGPGAVRLFCLLACYANEEREWPTQKQLAQELWCSENSLRKWMRELVSIGALEVRGVGRHRGYYLHFYPEPTPKEGAGQ